MLLWQEYKAANPEGFQYSALQKNINTIESASIILTSSEIPPKLGGEALLALAE